MAQYQWAAAFETLGASPALLDDVCDGDLSDWQIVDVAGAYQNRAAQLVSSTTGVRRRLALPGVVADGRVDVRGLFYKTTSTTAGLHTFIRNEGSSSTDGKDVYVNMFSDESLELATYTPTYTSRAKSPSFATAVGWWYVRYTYDPAATPKHTFKLWPAGDVEENAKVGTSDYVPNAVTNGRVGFGTGSTVESANPLYSWITVGTNGDDAALEPTAAGAGIASGAPAQINLSAPSGSATGTSTAPAVKGVTVALYDGATPQASVTGITARWWDSATAEGAPLLKTDTASTDASGVLTLDLDAVTSLAVGAEGYIVLYKAGATPQDDLHFPSRLTVSDIS